MLSSSHCLGKYQQLWSEAAASQDLGLYQTCLYSTAFPLKSDCRLASAAWRALQENPLTCTALLLFPSCDWSLLVFSQTGFSRHVLSLILYLIQHISSTAAILILSLLFPCWASPAGKGKGLRWWRCCCLQNSSGTCGQCRVRAFSASQSSVPTWAQLDSLELEACAHLSAELRGQTISADIQEPVSVLSFYF